MPRAASRLGIFPPVLQALHTSGPAHAGGARRRTSAACRRAQVRGVTIICRSGVLGLPARTGAGPAPVRPHRMPGGVGAGLSGEAGCTGGRVRPGARAGRGRRDSAGRTTAGRTMRLSRRARPPLPPLSLRRRRPRPPAGDGTAPELETGRRRPARRRGHRWPRPSERR